MLLGILYNLYFFIIHEISTSDKICITIRLERNKDRHVFVDI